MKFQQYFLSYTFEGKLQELKSTDFSEFQNDDLQLTFLRDDSDGNEIYSVHLLPKKKIELVQFYIELEEKYLDVKSILCNGFQSWTETRNFSKNEKIKPLRRGINRIAQAYGDALVYDYTTRKAPMHSWTYTALHLPNRKMNFYGSLNDAIGYTFFEHLPDKNRMYINKDCKGLLVDTEIELIRFFVSNGNEWMCWNNYLSAFALKPIEAKPVIGWTSWYYYYVDINEQIIEENIQAFKQHEVPIEIFQIDDGWQKSVGDWLHVNDKFPKGLKEISDKIHQQKNCKAGLWLAPLACEQKSFILKEKPHWILKNEKGEYLKIGFSPMWSYWFYALDIYNEEVREYLRVVFKTILHDWNFDLVKLDFLYGTALIPRNGKSRGAIMHDTMHFLRECVGDKMILGCGVPLSAAMNTTEYCRIGPDVHLSWDFNFLKWIRARERPSVLNAIHNTISRRQLSGKWFWNDPDVFILRDKKNKLSFNEKYSLLLANVLFGHLLFTSDNISEYDQETLFLYKSIFPLMPIEDAQVRFENQMYAVNIRIHDKYYLALLNMADDERMYKLPNGMFFDNVTQKMLKGDKMLSLKKHQSVCLLNVGFSPFAFAGSKGHFFSGAELDRFFISGNELEIEWNEKVLNDVTVFIKVPVHYEVKSVNHSTNFIRKELKEYALIEVVKSKLEENH